MQCINYILDLNPRLSNVIRRNGVIPKLMNIINSLGDISCLDSIVMVLDKISISNAILLLENNVFLTLLNVFDFMGKTQRKSIMKICQNISINILNYKQFDTYIKPASPILCNLIQYDENDTDPQILEKAIGIYYNIVINLKQAAEFEKMSMLEEELTKYNYFQNFCDILNKYFILRDKKITPFLVTKILQIISITCEISLLVVDKFLSINLLPILVEIINYEFNDQIFNNSSSSLNVINNDINNKANSTFLTDFFSVLISLFPFDDEKSKKDVKILSKKNKDYYLYFCKEILKPLVNNIMNKSACSNLSNLIKLLIIYIKTTEKDNIIQYIDSKPMAQIISKLLDTKFYPYLNDLSILIDILMSKAPEYYIKNFIREGIIENMKSYLSEEDKEINKIVDNKDKEKEKEKDKDKDKDKDKIKDKNKDNNDKIKSEEDIFKELLTHFKKDSSSLDKQKDTTNLLNEILMMDEQSFKNKKEEYMNEQRIITKKKINEIFTKYFTPEQIEIYNKKSNDNNNNCSEQGLTNLKDVLFSLEKDLSESGTKNKENTDKIFKTILDILTNPKNEITLFELENSNILLGLCEYFEPQFKTLFNKLDFAKDSELQKNIDLSSILPEPLIFNDQIFKKVQILVENLNESKEKLVNFIKLLEYSITSMNCFTMIIDDAQTNNLNFYYNQANLFSKRFNIIFTCRFFISWKTDSR